MVQQNGRKSLRQDGRRGQAPAVQRPGAARVAAKAVGGVFRVPRRFQQLARHGLDEFKRAHVQQDGESRSDQA